MKKLILLTGVLLALSSCAPSQQLISKTPQTTREAIVYDNKVVIVTKTTITKDRYNELMASRENKSNK